MQSKQELPRSSKKPILLFIAVFAILAYAVVDFVSMQVKLAQKSTEFNELSFHLTELKTQNEQLERYASDNYRLDYIEEIAREELDYSYPDEKIYYFVPSKDDGDKLSADATTE